MITDRLGTTGLVVAAVVNDLHWVLDAVPSGMGNAQSTGTVILAPGFAATAIAVVPTVSQLTHGNKSYLRQRTGTGHRHGREGEEYGIPTLDPAQLSELAQLAELSETNPGPVARLTRDAVIRTANSAARMFLGGREDIVGRFWVELCPEVT